VSIIVALDHEKTRLHIDEQNQAMTQQTTAHKTVMALKEHTRKDLEVKFRNVHAKDKHIFRAG
jgi:hypothetical protein